MFSVVNAVILRPLRFPQSDRLMTVLDSDGKKAYPPIEHRFAEWREASGAAFEKLAGAVATMRVAIVRGEPRTLRVVLASSELFGLLGVRPLAGRLFTTDEARPGSDPVVLLDEGFWRRELGSDPRVVGQAITLGGVQRIVVGILPAGLRFADFGARDLWLPLPARQASQFGGGYSPVVTVARLRPGVTRERAQAVIDSIMARLPYRRGANPQKAVVKPLRDWIVGDVRRTFFTLMGAAGFILLIACANVANLLLARATARQGEMAVRAALGAGRWRLARQALVESVLLGALGGAAGVALAFAVVRAIPAIKAIRIPRVEEVSVDGAMLLAAAAVSIAGGVLFGLAPALRPWSGGLSLRLHAAERAGTARNAQKLRGALVAVQLALGLVLLSGAGLMTNTLWRLLSVDLGFERARVLVVETVIPGASPQALADSMRSLAAEIRGMPGVLAAAAANEAPLEHVLDPWPLEAASGGQRRAREINARAVDPGYIRALGAPLLAGRDLELADDARTPTPVLLNQSAAQALFGRENPLGATVAVGRRGQVQVVGIVGDVRMFGVAIDPPPLLYIPLVRRYAYYVIVRTAPNAGDLTAAIRAAARRRAPAAPPAGIATLDEKFSEQIAQPRFYFLLLGAFAAIGLALAGVGVYGVISFAVARRRHEFGVRMAMGAERADILRLVLGSGLRMVCAGAVLGLAGALATTRLLASLLYGVRPGDPATLICVVLLLILVALGACYLAGRRATAVDPSAALRCE